MPAALLHTDMPGLSQIHLLGCDEELLASYHECVPMCLPCEKSAVCTAHHIVGNLLRLSVDAYQLLYHAQSGSPFRKVIGWMPWF